MVPLKIPTSTPAPDRDGPVAGKGGHSAARAGGGQEAAGGEARRRASRRARNRNGNAPTTLIVARGRSPHNVGPIGKMGKMIYAKVGYFWGYFYGNTSK